jgi:hypothetical protein
MQEELQFYNYMLTGKIYDILLSGADFSFLTFVIFL